MDIETNMEQIADQQDAFLDGWDDEVAVEETPETEVTEEETEVTEHTSETPEEAPAEEETETTAEPPVEETWTIKHMGTEQKLTKADITPELLQKGKDYDRIRAKWDEAKPVMELFSTFAKQANMSVADYAKSLRAEAKKATGMSDEEAQRTVELEDREAAVAAAEAERQEAANAEAASAEKIRKDLELFSALYPDIAKRQAEGDSSAIPQSVWDAVNKGESLVVAYKRYADEQVIAEKRQLEAKIAAAEQSVKNVGRSTGSMKSAGSDTKITDPFLDGWD